MCSSLQSWRVCVAVTAMLLAASFPNLVFGERVSRPGAAMVETEEHALVTKVEVPTTISANLGSWSEFGWGANGCSGEVSAIVRAPDGSIYVGGTFAACGDVVVNNVAHWLPQEARFEAVGQGVHGPVYALALSGTHLYAGGSFDKASGIAARNVARYEFSTGTWNALGSGVGVAGTSYTVPAVYALALGHGVLYAGGDFIDAGGITAHHIAQWDLTLGFWSPLGLPGSEGVSDSQIYPTWVRNLQVYNNLLYVGGTFFRAGGQQTGFLAMFNSTSQAWAGGGGISGDWLRDMTIRGGHLFVCGRINGLNQVLDRNLVTGQWSSLNVGAGFNTAPLSLAASDSRIYVGGNFSTIDGNGVRFTAQFNRQNLTWSSLSPSGDDEVNQIINTINVGPDALYFGGRLTTTKSGSVNAIAQFSLQNQQWTPLGTGKAPAVNYWAEAAAVDGDLFYVAGHFNETGGGSARGLVRYNSATGAWSSLSNAVELSAHSRIDALAIHGGDPIVAGTFSEAGGTPLRFIGRFDQATNAWESLGDGPENGVNLGGVEAIKVQGDDIYVGGIFTESGTVPTSGISRFNTLTRQWYPLGSGETNGVASGTFHGSVADMVFRGTDLYVTGDFASAGGVAAANVARYDTLTNTWSSLGSGLDNFGTAIDADDHFLYVGGGFSQAGGVPAYRVARYEFASGQWTGLADSGSLFFQSGQINSLYVHGPRLYAGGIFELPARNLAQLDLASGQWSSLAPSPDDEIYGQVRSVVGNGRSVLVSGIFQNVGGKINVNVAEYSLDRVFSNGFQ